MSESTPDDDVNISRDLYKEFKTETEKRQVSSSENFDKSVLTYSSWMFGISVAFLKDFILVQNSQFAACLYFSWALFCYSISSTTISFLLSYKGLELSLYHAEQYYLNNDDKFFNMKNPWNKAVKYINWSSGVSFIAAVILTLIFVAFNLGKNNMTKSKMTYDGMPASLMTKRPSETSQVEKKGMPAASMQRKPTSNEKPASALGDQTVPSGDKPENKTGQ